MSVAKVSEISACSTEGFDAAAREGISRASKTLDNIKGAWINEMKVECANGEITNYCINMKVTFVLKD